MTTESSRAGVPPASGGGAERARSVSADARLRASGLRYSIRTLVTRYVRALRPRWVTTTIVSVFVSGSPLLNRVVYPRWGGPLFGVVLRWLRLTARHGVAAAYAARPLPDVTEHPRG